MLRGYIEQVTPELISGWLYSDMGPLEGRRVLAMLDGTCIAVGTIEFFRQDLFDAGLGDGKLGFHFPLPKMRRADLARVTIRLEASDTDLLQAGTRVAGPGGSDEGATGPVAGLPDLPDASIRWMRARGWLAAREEEALLSLRRSGVCTWMLDAASPREDQEAEALTLLALRRVAPERQDVASLDIVVALCQRAMEEADPARAPLVALWCETPGEIGVAEASHRATAPEAGTAALDDLLIDYVFGPDRLLLLHQACRFVPRPRPGGAPLLVVTGRYPAEGRRGTGAR